MQRIILAGVLALALAPAAHAEVKITGETAVPGNKIVRLKAEGDITGAAFIWDVDREGDIDVVEQGATYLFTGPPGVYKVKLRTVRFKDGATVLDAARVTVTIGTPAPGPGPGPAPAPGDPLTQKLQAAYTADAGPDKDVSRRKLAAVYSAMTAHALNPKLKTLAELLADLREEVNAQLAGDALLAVRKIVADEIAATLGKAPNAPLTAENRKAASDLFARLSAGILSLR